MKIDKIAFQNSIIDMICCYMNETSYECISTSSINYLLKFLMDNDVDIDYNDVYLNYVVYIKNITLTKMLIKKGADVNHYEEFFDTCYYDCYGMPLFIAVITNNLKIAKILLENGADVSVKNKNGYTPLNIAIKHDFKEMVDLLIKYGAKENE